MDASPARFATNAESCSVRFVSRGTANQKRTALANAGVMLVGLRPSSRDAHANIIPTASAEPQRHDSSRPIGRILKWKKLSVCNQKQRTCRRKNSLSRTWVLRDLENRSFRASRSKWRPLQNSRCSLLRESVLFRSSQLRQQAREETWPDAGIRREALSSAKAVKLGWDDTGRTRFDRMELS